MTEPVIEATDVVKYLGTGAGRVAAVRGVSLSLTGGELVLLMGPSGSGKTTLLSMLGCMLTPTSGTVRMLGRSTAGLAGGRKVTISAVAPGTGIAAAMEALALACITTPS